MNPPQTKSDLSPAQWRAKRNISKATHYKLKRLGLAPAEWCPPGTNIHRITPAADAEWEAKMAELSQQQTAQLEQQRRVELAKAAGQAAAASPRHISRRGASNRYRRDT